MASVEIYTTPTCPYCHAAKQLLASKGIDYFEEDVSVSAERRTEMTRRAGGRHTVPQIFVGEHHVGGFDDLHTLDETGRLDALVRDAREPASAAAMGPAGA